MSTNVFLTGTNGYIGKNLYETLKDSATIYSISKYPEQSQDDVQYFKGDIFSLNDMIAALKGIDIAIYFLDPTKRSNKLNDATFKDMNAISADNFARAAEINDVKEIIYISGTLEDTETINILKSYKVPVRISDTKVRRPGILAQTQSSKTDDVRSIQRTLMPHSWSIEQAANHYFDWLNTTFFKFVKTTQSEDVVRIYFGSQHLLTLTKDTGKCDEYRLVYKINGGKMHYAHENSRARMEFRRLKGTDVLIIALHDYEPTLPWLLYMVTQAPIHHLTMKIFDVEMRIERFSDDATHGVKKTYTK